MRQQDQLALLVGNVTEWNRWREEHPDEETDVTGADLRDADLWDTNLHRATLWKANLQGASLAYTRLHRSDAGGLE
ncbi:MAG: pentapeptide repeat-containing protein [Ktedonobacterales bacterium]